MKVYTGENVRNVAVVGHGHAGKTSLVSAMLYTAGATPRLGRVDDGSATTDYDDEEVSRKMSIAASLACAEWGQTKINFLDTPGFNMFVHEAKMVLPVVDAARYPLERAIEAYRSVQAIARDRVVLAM